MDGIRGAILAQYGYGILTLLIAIIINRKIIFIGRGYDNYLSQNEKKAFLKLSIPSQLNATIAQMLMLVDVFLVGLILADEQSLATYKVATVLPSAAAFIPTSIMVYMVPYFARNINNYIWLKRRVKQVIFICVAICSSISVLGICLADWIVPLVFGSQYTDAVVCYAILMISFIFSGGLQIPASNILYTQRKVRANIVITSVCGVLNVILDIIGIKLWGGIGAAIATMIIAISGGLISCIYLLIFFKEKGEKK